MKYILRVTGGTIVSLSGIGIFLFGCGLFIQEQTWFMAGGLLTLFALGVGFLNLGLAIIRGKSIKDRLAFLFFVGKRTP